MIGYYLGKFMCYVCLGIAVCGIIGSIFMLFTQIPLSVILEILGSLIILAIVGRIVFGRIV